jgi:hypothetical protein
MDRLRGLFSAAPPPSPSAVQFVRNGLGPASSSPSSSSELPEEVSAALRANPDCGLAVEQTTRATLRERGVGTEDKSTRYFLQCPGRRRQLVHEEQTTAPLGGAGGRGDEDWRVPTGGGGGDGSGGLGGLPELDDFLRDFFGIPHEQSGMLRGGSGRMPFPLPLPREREERGWLGGGGGGGGGGAGTPSEEVGDGAAAVDPRRRALPASPPGLAERERGKGVLL